MTNVTLTIPDEVLSGGEVARIFRVDPKTVARWAKTGQLPSFQTVGGRRRYRRADVDAALAGQRLHVLPLTDAELQAAGDTLVKVLDRGWHGPLTDEEALPLFTLLRALPGGEAK